MNSGGAARPDDLELHARKIACRNPDEVERAAVLEDRCSPPEDVHDLVEAVLVGDVVALAQ